MQNDQRLTFRKTERLCSRAETDRLFAGGKSISAFPLRLVYIRRDELPEIPGKIMFVVPRRSFRKAHDRNRLRRRMRESFRHHKAALYAILKEKNKSVSMALLYISKEQADYSAIEKATVKLMEKLGEAV